MKKIPITGKKHFGLFALVDDDVFEWASKMVWNADKSRNTFYARHPVNTGTRSSLYMHRMIMNPPPGMVVDHINKNGLDNQRKNLRLATESQNHVNSAKRPVINGRKTFSKFKGVYQNKSGGKPFKCSIARSGKMVWSKTFATEIEAALAYNEKIKELDGEFASSASETLEGGSK